MVNTFSNLPLFGFSDAALYMYPPEHLTVKYLCRRSCVPDTAVLEAAVDEVTLLPNTQTCICFIFVLPLLHSLTLVSL